MLNAVETELDLFTNEPRREKTNILQHMRKNKGADQLRSNCEAGQRLCFRYMDSTIPLLSKFKSSNFCACIHVARFASNMFRNHIVCSHYAAQILKRQLIPLAFVIYTTIS